MAAEHDVEAQVRSAVAAGRKLEAIKLLRAATGMDLAEAKQVVESLGHPHDSPGWQQRPPGENDTGVGRLVLVLAVLGACLAVYAFLS